MTLNTIYKVSFGLPYIFFAFKTAFLIEIAKGVIEMRIGNKHAVIPEMGQGRIRIFGDDGVELVRIQSWIFKRVSTFGCADLFGILMAMDIDEVTREDLHWWIKNCSIDDFINEWTICLNKDDDIHYKYVATIKNFEYVEL